MKLKGLNLSRFAWIMIVIVAIFGVSIVATGYYYYVIPHPTRLRILYTHPDSMVNEIADDFKEWYGRPIKVTLTPIDPQSAYEVVTNIHKEPEAEIWWGGQLSIFEEASNSLLAYNSTNRSENITVHSCRLMDLSQSTPHWYAASLQGLGVMYNETSPLKPQTWTDLLEEECEGNITMVDPTESEFTQPFIMLMIQSKNWAQGWEYLVKLAAFVKDYDDNETTSALKVTSGYLPLAVVPDFYAYNRIQELEQIGIHSTDFTYLNATVLQPDPIAIIRRGKYLEEAKAFVDYILTKQAQDIIGKYRLPIRQDATVVSPRINPFDPNFPSVSNYNKTFEEVGKDIIKAYYRAWITERHDEEPSIETAWKEIKEANESSPYYAPAWNNFTMAGYYINRTSIDAIYTTTEGWTKNLGSYVNSWRVANKEAYDYAIENAKKAQT